MKHATSAALDRLEPLLRDIRMISELRERSRGVFYRRGKAFLHFHEDPAGLFGDLREGEDFVRYKVDSAAEEKRFLKAVRSCV